MIDWITVALPLDWETSIDDGKYIILKRDGSKKLEVGLRLSIGGAYDGSITARTIMRKEQKFLEISGNPIKFAQGHNLFGTNNLRALIYHLACHICALPIVPLSPDFAKWAPLPPMAIPTEANLEDWRNGNYTMSRVDIAEMVSFSSRAEVRSVLHFLREGAVIQHRGRGHWHDGTLYFGKAIKGSRALPWMLKFYCKGDEMELNEIPSNADDFDAPNAVREWGGNLDKNIQFRDNLCLWADNKLRPELTLRTKELQKLGLYSGEAWKKDTASTLFSSYLSRLEISNAPCEAVEETASLPIGPRRTLSEWRRGGDVTQYLNRQTLYRHRKQIFEATGIDITTEPQSNPPTIPIRKMLIEDFRPEPIPSWADRMLSAINMDDDD